MKTRSRMARLVALSVVVSLPVLATSGIASAAKVKVKPTHCHKTHSCHAGAGGGTGGTGSTPANIVVSVSPNPMQESGESDVLVTVQVEALPIFADQTVDISSQQLADTCSGVEWLDEATAVFGPAITVILDNDGNASVLVQGTDCAPGTNLFEADLHAAPYTTATAELTTLPPAVTTSPTITAFPNPEVETGDGGPGNAESQVYVSFLIEEDPVYAEQIVDVTSPELLNRCAVGNFTAFSNNPDFHRIPGGVAVSLDNDGNAVVIFLGQSCAPGESTVVGDLTVGTHDTFTTDFTISPPKVTNI